MKNLSEMWLSVIAFGVAAALAAAEVQSPDATYPVYKTVSPIVIDGKFDEEAWKDAAPSPVFAEIVDGSPARYPVKAKVMWDDQYLYFSLSADDPDVWASDIVRDDPMGLRIKGLEKPVLKKNEYRESFFKIYLAPDAIGQRYTETHVNPLNKVCDKWHKSPPGKAACERTGATYVPNSAVPEWNCEGMKSAVLTRGTLNDPYDIDDGWQAEVAIPFASLKHLAEDKNYPPKIGDRWKAHLGRRYAFRDNRDALYWTWPVIGIRDCHNPDKWGYFVFAGPRTCDRSEKTAALPKANFSWRALWIYSENIATDADVDKTIALAESMNINVLIAATAKAGTPEDRLAALIEAAKAKNIQVYAWTVNLQLPPATYFKEHPELEQRVQPWEEGAIKLPRANPDRVNVHGGHWLCPDRGLDPAEAKILTELFSKYDLDGIGLDYLGYRNYYACFCDYSNEQRLAFARKHPELDAKEVLTRFSEERLIEWTRQVRELILKIKPRAKLAIHIYPDFDLDPLYAAKLPVDYRGQTVAWFYKPFWSYGKILDLSETYQAAPSGEYAALNKFTPFIGVYGGDKLKTPERLRREIRIAGATGAQSVMFAFAKTFLEHPELAKVVGEELMSR